MSDLLQVKRAQFHDEIYKKGWRGLRVDSKEKALDMLKSMDDKAEENVKKKADDLYEKLLKVKDPLRRHQRLFSMDHPELNRIHISASAYLLDRIFWSSVNYLLAIKIYNKIKKLNSFSDKDKDSNLRSMKLIAMRSLFKSSEILCEVFGLGVYSYYNEDINKVNKERAEAAKKSRQSRTENFAYIKQVACELIYEHKPPGEKWKNKTVAAKGIERDLWDSIVGLKEAGNNIDLSYESLVRTILRWSTQDGEIKKAMQKTVKGKIRKITAKKTKNNNR